MRDRVKVCMQIAHALAHLHGMLMPYGLLSASAVRVDERSGDIKLSPPDLGRYALRSSAAAALPASLSRADAEAKSEAEASAQALSGYWAPEKLLEPSTVTAATDVYAFGSILYAVLMQAEPWFSHSFEAIRAAVLGGERPKLDKARTGNLPMELLRLTSDCLATAPNERPPIEVVVDRLRACIELEKLIGITAAAQWHSGTGANPSATASASAAPVVAPTGPVGVGAASGLDAKGTELYVPSKSAPSVASVPSLPLERASDSRSLMESLARPLEPLNPQFGDGPSVEACDAAREQALAKLGTIDKKMLVGEHVATCALYIIHRTHSGNVALVTRGLSDPSTDSPGTTGLGIELLAEAKEADVGTGAVLGASYLFQMMHEVPQAISISLPLTF